MEINWKKEVEIRKTELLEDLFTLLRIDSVRDDSKITPDAPVGPGPKEALEAFLAIGRTGWVHHEKCRQSGRTYRIRRRRRIDGRIRTRRCCAYRNRLGYGSFRAGYHR